MAANSALAAILRDASLRDAPQDEVEIRDAVVLADGSEHLAEIHWYEAGGIGRRELKIKHLL